MRLSRLFVDQALAQGLMVRLDSDSSHYLKNVLRLPKDSAIRVFNGLSQDDFEARIGYEGKQAILTLGERIAGGSEPGLHCEIVQGLSRSDRMDWMIQKSTELGVSRISIFNAKHTQIRLKATQLGKKLKHWQNIAIKACEQCGRQIPPHIDFYPRLAELLDDEAQDSLKLLLDFEGEKFMPEPTDGMTAPGVRILVGPEGGLADTEIEAARTSGFVVWRLGPRILRTETAALTALAIVQHRLGDL